MEELKDKTNFIDLGLPSGTLWADRNLGAENITDHGFYFQYGAVKGYMGDEAKAHSTWKTCPSNGGGKNFDKTAWNAWKTENTTDGVLNPSVDAVYQATGGKAKMPTKEQVQELIDNTNQEWVTIEGVNGRKFTSKVDSFKFIFIPVAGRAYNGGIYGISGYQYFYILSSSFIELDELCAFRIYSGKTKAYIGISSGFIGASVRGVAVD